MEVVQETKSAGDVLVRISGSVKIQDIAELYRRILPSLQASVIYIDTTAITDADFSLIQLLAAVNKEMKQRGTTVDLKQHMGQLVCRIASESGYLHRICNSSKVS